MGIRSILRRHEDSLRVIGEASSGKGLLELLGRVACDLLITDFSMPDVDGSADGLLLIRQLRRHHPNLPIIVLTMIHNPALVRGMLAAGVNGVVGKAAMTQELVLAQQAVTSGRTYLSMDVRGKLDVPTVAEEQEEKAPAPGTETVSLSPREAEVVRMYAGGLTVTQIAERLRRSVKTVSQQKNDAMRKLGLTSNSQLYEFARDSGLLA